MDWLPKIMEWAINEEIYGRSSFDPNELAVDAQ